MNWRPIMFAYWMVAYVDCYGALCVTLALVQSMFLLAVTVCFKRPLLIYATSLVFLVLLITDGFGLYGRSRITGH